jgi:hypothetical protein
MSKPRKSLKRTAGRRFAPVTLLDGDFFAVLLRRSTDQSPFIAYGANSTPALFRSQKDARSYRADLSEHGCSRGAVVRLRLRYRVLSSNDEALRRRGKEQSTAG